MKLVILFLCFARIFGLNHVQYKLLSLDDFQWSSYVSKTISFKVNNIIECGAACSAQSDGACHLYAPEIETKTCHIGTFETMESNGGSAYYYYDVPNEEPIGTQPVYISLSKLFLF